MQRWTFTPDEEDVVRIGRATDNQIILFSAVVSRHHAELRWDKTNGWQIVNISANGTYVEGEPIDTQKIYDNMTIRLATSGPRIQINIGHNE
jgi:pSer/pThr/pTyr-binding forkhead associated (FHA) protein